MKITPALLRKHGACSEQVEEFTALYPRGTEPTVDTMFACAAAGLDIFWCLCLLPLEGPGSQRAFSLWCAEQVAHLSDDPRVAECLAVVRTRVLDPASVTDNVLAAAWDTAMDAARAAAWDTAKAAAWDAAWAAAMAADMAAEMAAASDAARAAASDAATAAARAAAAAAARAAAMAAQIAILSQMLLEA